MEDCPSCGAPQEPDHTCAIWGDVIVPHILETTED